MRSLILHIAVRVLFPILIIASLMSLFRGHHEPGGGFIGGLVAASAYILLTLSMGVKKARSRLPMEPLFFMSTGLFISFLSAVLPMFFGNGYMEALWAGFYLPVIGMPGTPLMFDIGVYMLVTGIVCKIIFTIGD